MNDDCINIHRMHLYAPNAPDAHPYLKTIIYHFPYMSHPTFLPTGAVPRTHKHPHARPTCALALMCVHLRNAHADSPCTHIIHIHREPQSRKYLRLYTHVQLCTHTTTALSVRVDARTSDSRVIRTYACVCAYLLHAAHTRELASGRITCGLSYMYIRGRKVRVVGTRAIAIARRRSRRRRRRAALECARGTSDEMKEATAAGITLRKGGRRRGNNGFAKCVRGGREGQARRQRAR